MIRELEWISNQKRINDNYFYYYLIVYLYNDRVIKYLMRNEI